MPSPKKPSVLCSQILEAEACDRDIRVWMHGHKWVRSFGPAIYIAYGTENNVCLYSKLQ